jgi:hypothetical protein
MVVCRQHTLTTSTPQSTHIHDIRNTYIATHLPTTMTLPSYLLDSYKQILLKERPTPLFADDHIGPRNRLVGHPLAPFLTAPQLATAEHGRGTPMEPTPGTGLRTPLVLTAPRNAPDLGRAVDLSARMIDSYLLTCQYSTAPPDLASFWLHGVFLPGNNAHLRMLSCSALAPRKRSHLNQYPGSREKYNRSGTRPSCSMDGLHTPPCPSNSTALPYMSNSRMGTRKSAWTYPPLAQRLACYINSLHASVNSRREVPHLPAPPRTLA